MVCTRAALATWLYRAKKVSLIFHINKAELCACSLVLNLNNAKQVGYSALQNALEIFN